MANYNSIPQRFNRPTSNINHAYIDATLKNQQSVIDTNFGLLQQTVDLTLGQDLARESDRQYLKNKVRGVLNTLDSTDAIRFDSKKARFTIQDALSDAAKDPEVLKQVSNTKKIRAIQEFQKKRLNKGDLNQQNFQYAMHKSGVNQYLSGASNDLNDFQYLEYVDVDAKLDEVARKLKAANPNELVSIQNPLTGETVSKKVSMITPEEMRSYLRVQLNANDLKQLEIDGAMLYGLDNTRALQVRDNLIAKSNKKYNDQIALLENYRDNGNKTKGQIAIIDQQIKALNAEKSYYEKNMIGQKTAESIGGQQLIENKLALYSQLYTKNGPESIKYDSDALKRLRDANSYANVQNGVPGNNPNISTITTPTDLPDSINPYKESLNRIETTLAQNSKYIQDQFDLLTPDKKKLVQDTMDKIKNDPEVLALYKGQNLSNEMLQLETINRLGPNFFSPDVAQKLRSAIISTKTIQEAINTTTNEFMKTKALNEEMYDQLFSEETNLTMVTAEGDVNIQQFLRDNGVRDRATYESFVAGESDEAKQLRATLALQSMSLTTDDILDGDIALTDNPLSAFGVLGNIGSTAQIDLNESQYRMIRQAAHDLTGEALDETYSIEKNGEDYKLTLKNPNTNFSTIVERTNSLYQSGRTYILGGLAEMVGFDIDRTVRNESSIRSLYSDEDYQEFAENNFRFLDKTVVGTNSIRIKGDNKKNVDPIYEEILQYVSNVTFDKRLPIDVYRRENGELLVTQIVQDETAVTNDEAKEKRKIREGVIRANDVSKMNLFNNQINLMQKENTFRRLEDNVGEINQMNFIGNERTQVEGLNRLYDRNNQGENTFRLLSAEDTARNMIFNSTVQPYLNNVQGMQIKEQFEDFVTNTQNYKLDFTKGIDSDYQVLIKDINGKNIGSIPLNNNISVETFEKSFYGTPQVFLALYSKSQVDKYMNSMLNGRR